MAYLRLASALKARESVMSDMGDQINLLSRRAQQRWSVMLLLSHYRTAGMTLVALDAHSTPPTPPGCPYSRLPSIPAAMTTLRTA